MRKRLAVEQMEREKVVVVVVLRRGSGSVSSLIVSAFRRVK